MSDYLLDGQPVEFTQLIKAAEQYGYGKGEFMLCTSGATNVLREYGHKVEDMPTKCDKRNGKEKPCNARTAVNE